jgi:hypothetical protein
MPAVTHNRSWILRSRHRRRGSVLIRRKLKRCYVLAFFEYAWLVSWLAQRRIIGRTNSRRLDIPYA